MTGTWRSRCRLVVFAAAALLASACSETSTLVVHRNSVGDAAAVNGAPTAAADGTAVAGPDVAQGTTTGATPGGGQQVAVGGADLPPSASETVEGPIRIGVLSTLSGGQRFVGEPPYRVALAYAQRLADRGGINGRNIEVLGYDVCTNCPDEGLAQARRAVENDDVFALANTFVVNAALDQVVPYLNEQGVPMIQGSSGEQSRRPELSPLNFSIGLTVPGRAAIDADFAKRYLEEHGLPPRVALLYFTDALTSYIAEEQRAALQRVGLEIVDEEPVSYDATMTNQTAQVLKMRAAGAQLVVGSHGVLCAFSMQAATQAGWQAPYVCTVMYDPFTIAIAGPAAIEGRDVFADSEGYATADLAGDGVQDYLELMRDYYPDGDIGLITMYSYLGMRLIEEGVRSMGDNVTRQGLAQYIEGLTNYTAGGLTPPFTLGPNDHGGIDGAQIVQFHADGTIRRISDDWVYPDPIHGLPGPAG